MIGYFGQEFDSPLLHQIDRKLELLNGSSFKIKQIMLK